MIKEIYIPKEWMGAALAYVEQNTELVWDLPSQNKPTELNPYDMFPEYYITLRRDYYNRGCLSVSLYGLEYQIKGMPTFNQLSKFCHRDNEREGNVM